MQQSLSERRQERFLTFSTIVLTVSMAFMMLSAAFCLTASLLSIPLVISLALKGYDMIPQTIGLMAIYWLELNIGLAYFVFLFSEGRD